MSDQAESRKRLVLLIVLLAAAGGGLFWVSTRPPETPDAAIQTKVDDLQAILDDAKVEFERQREPSENDFNSNPNHIVDMRKRAD